ncbi:alpha-glucoside transport system substrate-binding protein [Crossiella equi]|uniref:Alpha-glucoside transport system substrate-binding protein n=1 Tax=Crossiella equi TaxID=130796 RepID=A0ABS5AIZ7_9PSEU|nr:hypothetical protein [Crossiella equi]MBP2476550.1 alpha-glucoside transport system substrate-binding protein [Crossiella equi]
MRRLAALAAVGLLLAAVPACTAAAEPEITVLASWTGEEEAAFMKVVKGFTDTTGLRVRYRGTRALGQVLAAEVKTGRPPDIAVLPGLGDLMPYVRDGKARQLGADVDESQRQDARSQWPQLQRGGRNQLYAIQVKADPKGLVWFNPRRGTPPDTAEGLLAGGGWCLGLGSAATSGWPGTDWIETLLLQRYGPELYQRWVAGGLPWTDDRVRQAWLDYGRVVPATVPATLLTDFADAGAPMFDPRPGCSREHQGGFIALAYRGREYERDYDFRPFPPFPGAPQASLVSADLAALFTDNGHARALLRHLAANPVPQPGTEALATRLTGRANSEQPMCFDASDLMPVELRTVFYRAVLEFTANQAGLPELLARLENVRLDLVQPSADQTQWVTVSCGKGRA